MHSPLPKTYKARFPFKLGTTSFIYRDSWAANVEMLAPHLDEIELVLFESEPDALPAVDEIRTLHALSVDHGISYNVHLPIDIRLGSRDTAERRHALETVRRVTDLTGELQPSTFTLHLAFEENGSDRQTVHDWQERVANSLDRMLNTGLPAHLLSVENLNYPLDFVEKIIRDLGLRVCVDIGHLVQIGGDIRETFDRFGSIIPIIHLYGIGRGGKHFSLEKLPQQPIRETIRFMKSFSGTVSLEVFSYDDLSASLEYLEKVWNRWT